MWPTQRSCSGGATDAADTTTAGRRPKCRQRPRPQRVPLCARQCTACQEPKLHALSRECEQERRAKRRKRTTDVDSPTFSPPTPQPEFITRAPPQPLPIRVVSHIASGCRRIYFATYLADMVWSLLLFAFLRLPSIPLASQFMNSEIYGLPQQLDWDEFESGHAET